MTQACRPRHISRPTGLPVSRIARAAILRAALSVDAPASSYGPTPSMLSAGRPAGDTGALALEAVRPGAAPGPGQPLEPALRLGGPVAAGLDHVEHHLHARADALDEVRLGDEVRRVGRGPACSPGRRGRRRRDGRRVPTATARQGPARRRRGRAGASSVARSSSRSTIRTTGEWVSRTMVRSRAMPSRHGSDGRRSGAGDSRGP